MQLRCRTIFKAIAICVFLGTVLCVLVNYLRNQGSDSTFFNQLLERSVSVRSLFVLEQNEDRRFSDIKGGKAGTRAVCLLQTTSNLTRRSVEDVQTFVFFIGYPRSGHSTIASMIDAHPDAIVAHEFHFFAKIASELSYGQKCLLNKTNLFNVLYRDSFVEATLGWRSGSSGYDKKGYSLKLNQSESWQGRFASLKVIGDKAGGKTARFFRDEPNLFQEIYHSLADSIGIPIRVIHVVRNPFDMIATRLLYRLSGKRREKAQFNSTNRLSDERIIKQATMGLYGEAKAVQEMTSACNLTILETHYSDLIRDPRSQISAICKFLGLNCTESYLQMCEKATFSELSRTRDALQWSEPMMEFVTRQFIASFPCFHRYSFVTD